MTKDIQSLARAMNSPFRNEDYLETQVGRMICLLQILNLSVRVSYIRPSEIGRANLLCLCSWNCHLNTGYFDLFQLIEEFSSIFYVVGICERFLNSDLTSRLIFSRL